tara:strand:- start:805 stop:1665 length:861 start_codon:yes stop_codon:yes gene_type:complete
MKPKMINKNKKIYFFFIIQNIILFLQLFIFKVNAETKIIANEGDTLIKISKQYGISLKELMHKNNYNDANKIIEGKVISIPTKYIENDTHRNSKYKVKEGDTLYGIARKFDTNLRYIFALNNLDNNSILKPNQIILLPQGAIIKQKKNKKTLAIANNKVFYHQTIKGEKLEDIALLHNISIEEIIALNEINYPTKFDSSFEIKLREPRSPNWQKYGSIIIDWSSWKYLDSYYIAKAKNKKNKSFLLAIDCERRVLSNTIKNSYWANWDFPKANFEYKIINNFCKVN